MSERTEPATSDVDVTVEETVDGEDVARGVEVDEKPEGGDREPVTGHVISVGVFALMLGVTLAGMYLVSEFLPFGGLAGYVGIAIAGFVVGVADSTARYLEAIIAGAIAAGVGMLTSNLVLTMLGVGVPIVALGAALGAVSALVGHYFGRDLRDGLTKDVSQ